MSEARQPKRVAWYVTDSSEEWGEIVYATSRGQARMKGAAIGDGEFCDISARRRPQYDEFDPRGPSRERLFNDGWWFECEACPRQARAGDGVATFREGGAWCDECAVKRWPDLAAA